MRGLHATRAKVSLSLHYYRYIPTHTYIYGYIYVIYYVPRKEAPNKDIFLA